MVLISITYPLLVKNTLGKKSQLSEESFLKMPFLKINSAKNNNLQEDLNVQMKGRARTIKRRYTERKG